ncbi:SusE domain-containing protein [Winogradskyella litorisediminis]|uniref:SusE domain-containing protein n=1 Tax=Winogradskyella litorisediminis TaxID=1156618 RepID=A0ABW3N7Q0_9FLAO
MKNIKILGLALCALLSFNSCQEEDNFVIESAASRPAEISLPTASSSIVLDIENPDAIATTVVWDDAIYNVPTEIQYTVQLANSGTDFANPIDAGTTNETFLAWTNSQLNGVAVDLLQLTPFSAADVDLRIKSSLGQNDSEATFSEIVTFSLTPYTTEAPMVFIVGNFLSASGYGDNWTPANAVPISASGFGETDFEGYVYMNEAAIEFKILPTNESFDGDYGDDGTFSGTLIQEGESNIQIGTGAGYYYIQADTDALTYSAQRTSWAITGSATPAGWPDNGVMDQDMTYNETTSKWEITIALDAAGEYKFRANDGWDLNFGTDGDDNGSLDYGGGNFSVPSSGTYLVELDLSNPRAYTQTITLQ